MSAQDSSIWLDHTFHYYQRTNLKVSVYPRVFVEPVSSDLQGMEVVQETEQSLRWLFQTLTGLPGQGGMREL